MEGFLTLFAIESLALGALLGLLAKGAVICLLGLSVGSELSFMPAVVRHRVALGTVFCLAVLPLLSWGIPAWELPILPRDTVIEESGAWNFVAALVPVYLGVALLLLARLCVDISRMALLSGRAISSGSASALLPGLDHPRGNVQVKFSKEIRTPLTWGWLKPRVLLPQQATDWDTDDLSMVLQHELTHIERADWMGHLLARSVHALYWPVPGISHLMRQLSLSMEQACDDRVLATGVAAPSYAAMLLRQASGNRVPATVSLGHGSELGIRIRYLVVEIVDHSVLARGTGSTLIACVVLSVPLAAMQLGERPELPEFTWGSVNLNSENVVPVSSLDTLQFDESVLSALHPGPEHPVRPPAAERPPKYKGQEKPSIPPP